MIVISLFFSLKNSDLSKNNFGNVFSNVLSGQTKLVRERWESVLIQLNNSDSIITVKKINIKPEILFHGEIDSLKNNQYNFWMAGFYNVSGVHSE